jgi:hypothetical protein
MAVLPLPALLVLAAVGCAAPPPPPSTLSESQARSVWLPERLGWVSSERASGALPSAIALGGKASGRVLVYLEFDAPPEPGRLLRAALLLDTDGAPGSSIEVELSRADPARARLDSWSDQPAARYPRLSRSLSSAPAPVRLDVTALVRAERKVGEPLRLLLRAEPSSAEPVLLATGAAGGAAPRLEIYRE